MAEEIKQANPAAAVAVQLCTGQTNKKIAKALSVSGETVKVLATKLASEFRSAS